MKLKKIIELSDEFRIFFTQYRIDLLAKFKLRDVTNVIRPHVEGFNELRESYLKEHGEADESGHPRLSREKTIEFTKELEKLLDSEVDIALPKIPYSLIESVKGEGLGDFPLIFDLVEIK